MADEIDNNDTDTETEGSMIERMMRGEFDSIEISEEVPTDDSDSLDADDNTDSDDNIDTDIDSAQAAVNDDDDNSDDNSDDDSNLNSDSDDNDDTASVDSADDDNVDDSDTNNQDDGTDSDNDDNTDDSTDDDDSVNDPVASDSDSDTDTKDQDDGLDSDNDEPNYKEQYEKLLEDSKLHKDYYDKVTGEFTANGQTVHGFKDPDKTIQAMQAMYGLEDKFSKLKKYKKFHAPLEKRGMITDQAKFDLAMNIMDGDKEAMKAHMKNLNMEPIDFDMDEVNYKGQSAVSSDIELNLNDMLDVSATAGIKQDVERVLYNDWDQDSVVDLLSTEGSRNMFVEHMKPDADGNSVFNTVSSKVKEMSVLNAGFSDQNDIQKYNAALQELEKEYSEEQARTHESDQAKSSVNDAIAEAQSAEAKKISDAEEAAVSKYKLELENKNKVADDARKKAASVSQKKTVKKNVKKEPDPMKLEGDDFMDYWKRLERAGLK